MGADPACRDAAPGPCAPIQKEHGAGTDGPPLRERSVGCPSRGKTGLRFAFPSASGSRFAWLYGRSLPARMSAFALLREWGNRLFEFGYDQRNRLGISVACAARFRRFCAVDEGMLRLVGESRKRKIRGLSTGPEWLVDKSRRRSAECVSTSLDTNGEGVKAPSPPHAVSLANRVGRGGADGVRSI